MTFFDGRTFWVKAEAGEPLSIVHLGFNEFVLAASPERNPNLRAGLALQPIDGLTAEKHAESDDRKVKD